MVVPTPESSISQIPFNVRSRSQQLTLPALSTNSLLNRDQTESDLGADPACFFGGPVQVHQEVPNGQPGYHHHLGNPPSKIHHPLGCLHQSICPLVHLWPGLGNYSDLGGANYSGIWTNLPRVNYPQLLLGKFAHSPSLRIARVRFQHLLPKALT